MADELPPDLDITTDLNAQSPDAIPYHGDAVPTNRQGDTPVVLPDKGAEAPAPTLRDLLSDAFKGDAQQVPAVPGTEQAKEGVAPTASPSELVKVGDRWHRKDGSFASKEDIQAHEAAVAAAQGQPAPVQTPPWVAGLTPLEQQQFSSLPAETRQFVERTMDGVNQRALRYQEYDIIEQVIGPRRQAWAADGATPAVALQQLLALSDFAGRDPGQFALWFADQHQIDLDALLDARDAAGGEPDPRYIGLQQEIAQLRNAINGFTQNTVQSQQAQNLQLVQSFIEEKDDKGNLLHPYFSEVANEISQHVAVLRQQQPYLAERDVLRHAYDFATYSNPNVRARVQQSQADALKNSAAAEAARARQAGVSINGGPAGDAAQQPNNANRTLRDELVHAYNQSVAT